MLFTKKIDAFIELTYLKRYYNSKRYSLCLVQYSY
jgi:transposase InsO family protein